MQKSLPTIAPTETASRHSSFVYRLDKKTALAVIEDIFEDGRYA